MSPQINLYNHPDDDPDGPWGAQIIWYFQPSHPSATRPGSFRHALIVAMGSADPINSRLIARGFPEAVAMWHLICANSPNGFHYDSSAAPECSDS